MHPVKARKLLGLQKGCATEAEMRSAFRRVALQYHPDKDPSALAKAKSAPESARGSVDRIVNPKNVLRIQGAHKHT